MKKLANSLIALSLTALSATSHSALIYSTDLNHFNSVTSSTLVEDFEDFAAKNQQHSSFTSNGITYTNNVYVSSPGFTNYGLPGPTTSSILTTSGDEDYRLNFSSFVSAVAFDTYLNIYGPAEISVYGTNGLIDTFIHTHDSTQVGFFGVTSTEQITAVRWNTTAGGIINTGIDNIRLSGSNISTSVPEPSTLILSIIALFMLRIKTVTRYFQRN